MGFTESDGRIQREIEAGREEFLHDTEQIPEISLERVVGINDMNKRFVQVRKNLVYIKHPIFWLYRAVAKITAILKLLPTQKECIQVNLTSEQINKLSPTQRELYVQIQGRKKGFPFTVVKEGAERESQ